MRLRLSVVGGLSIVSAVGCTPSIAARAAASREPLAIVGVTVIDPDAANPATPDQTILIDGGIIRAIGDSRRISVPAGARIVNGAGRFAMPGLWDMHVHFMNAGVTALPLLLAHGVTSVREMGGYLDSTRAWQTRMRSGALVGPRIVTPGPMLESPQYLENVRVRSARLDGRLAARVLPYRVGIANEADARRVMDSLAALKVDFVKIRTTASADAFYAILRQARRVGLRVAGHPPTQVSLASISDSGQNTIEHGFFPPLSQFPPARRDSLYQRFVRNGTWYTPTLVVSRVVLLSGDSAVRAIFGDSAIVLDERRRYASPWLLGWWRMQVDERIGDTSSARAGLIRMAYASSVDDVRLMHAAGVNMLAGTDAGSVLVYPGFSLHEELRLWVTEAGLPPKAALWSATVGPARFLGMETTLGSIARGKIADMVLLEADPLADIANTRRIFAVVQAGRLFDRAALDALLREVRDAAR